MSDEDILQQSTDGERRANMARLALGLTIALSMVNIIGGTAFWLSLPEKLKRSAEIMADHEARLRIVEKDSSTQAGTLGRIDERTRNIQETITEVRSSIREARGK